MMGRLERGQEQLFYAFNLDDAVPQDHQVRSIAAVLDLSWVHGALAPHYSNLGRPSIDPELMLRMLILGYVFAIRSERQLVREVQVNLAYRWFCGLGIEDKVACRFEFVSEPERILHYAAADVCIFPSVYEPFGIVSLESMAMAKPVIVGAQGVIGFREQVLSAGPDQNGIHVNGESPLDIAWGINETLHNPQRAKQWGEKGRQRVLNYFTWRKAAEQTLEVYETLVAKRATEY